MDRYRYFRIEAKELLDGLSEGVLALEKRGDDLEVIARLLRLAHTLKGAARVVGQTRIADRAHAMEDVLAEARERRSIPPERCAELLPLLDEMSALLAEIERPAPAAGEEARDAPKEDELGVRAGSAELDSLLRSVHEARSHLHALHKVGEGHARARDLVRAAADAGKAGASFPSLLLEETLAVLEAAERARERETRLLENALTRAKEAAEQQKLVPARAVFSLLARAVRDAAAAEKKSARFSLVGGEARLDGGVLSHLRDALLHAVWNAVAHGIETPEQRRLAKKPEEGSIELEVQTTGHDVVCVLRDDGRGLDVEAVRDEAMRQGRLPPEDAARLDARAAASLLLSGSLSTLPRVTGLAGRGVGLDAIREIVSRLGGSVHLSTEPGSGTTLTLRAPISLTSVPALLVEAAGTRVAFPLDHVEEVLRVAPDEIVSSDRGASVVRGDDAISFVPLGPLLGRPVPKARARAFVAVVVEVAGRRLGVGVDRCVRTTSVVMRALPASLQADPMLQGAFFDEEGTPRLVLSAAGLLEAAAAAGPLEEPPPPRRAPLLVVDDSLTTRMLEQTILESAGYEVDLAQSAEEALEKARARRYGLLLVDVEMPGMSGFDLLEKMKDDATLSDVPAVLVTSRSSADDLRRGREAGAKAYVVKSELNQRELLGIIEDLLR